EPANESSHQQQREEQRTLRLLCLDRDEPTRDQSGDVLSERSTGLLVTRFDLATPLVAEDVERLVVKRVRLVPVRPLDQGSAIDAGQTEILLNERRGYEPAIAVDRVHRSRGRR